MKLAAIKRKFTALWGSATVVLGPKGSFNVTKLNLPLMKVLCVVSIYITFNLTTLSFWLTLLLGNKKNVFKDIYFDSIRQVFVS